MTLVDQRARCDCVVAATAMYCGVDYEQIWWRMTRRERWIMSYGQGLFFLPMARIVQELTEHQLLWVEQDRHGPLAPCDFPAILVVHSTLVEGARHVVYWDGVRVWDPQFRCRMPVTWPGRDQLVGVHPAIHHFDDIPEDFDWYEWAKHAGPMTFEGALGRDYAEGLLPWRGP